MRIGKKLTKQIRAAFRDENFLHQLENIEGIVSKILSIAMILVILLAIWNLGLSLVQTLIGQPDEPFTKTLFKIFGLFLNVLIALEILENITAYLKKHVIQVELVIVTSIIAVARKIIILDLEKTSGVDIIGLGIALLSLSISYWIIRHMNAKQHNE
ncbi:MULTISPECIES: phosphate-starvation-inducible PsiE family protein [unclassified Coleofasciculus]|uniref:phosphate-starvation-inducible PsiE family protein n=1 Tax=Cyanophyceae TaxID=3028117 RepID=UPI001688E787|nr:MULTISPECIES: phosphate-starvation-inducible PsiE family protein [unclassified Coleofasciculus]MBD1879786.1 phosphate-starvation-inducible PsiE family protein [Coleofasciculus sp. FACHB-T130]MBD1895143.1 phosphate-starvation-inducible PsiE family protein [Coleofasciculus sp. FACHB-129]